MILFSIIICFLWSSPESKIPFDTQKKCACEELGNLFRPYVKFFGESLKTIERAREGKNPELFKLTASYRVVSDKDSRSLFELHIQTCEDYRERACSFLTNFSKNCRDEKDVKNFIVQALKSYGSGLAEDRMSLSRDYLQYKNKTGVGFISEGVYASDDALIYYENIKSYDAILIAAWRRRSVGIMTESLLLLLKLFPEAKNEEIDRLLSLYPKFMLRFENPEFFEDPEELALTDGTNYLCKFGRVVHGGDKSEKLIGDPFFILGDGSKEQDQLLIKNVLEQNRRCQVFFPAKSEEHVRTEKERSNEIRRTMKALYGVSREIQRARNRVYDKQLKKLAKPQKSLAKKEEEESKNFPSENQEKKERGRGKGQGQWKGKRHQCPSAAEETEGQQFQKQNESNTRTLREEDKNFKSLTVEATQKQKTEHQPMKIRINKEAEDLFKFLKGFAEFAEDEGLTPVSTKNIDVIIALLNGDYLNCNVRSDLVPALERIGVQVDNRTVSSHWKLFFINRYKKKHTGTLWMPHGSAKESEVLISKGFGYAMLSSSIDFLKGCGFSVINGQLFLLAPSNCDSTVKSSV